MSLYVILFAAIAAASAASIANEYIPPVADNSLPIQEYIPPEIRQDPAALSDEAEVKYGPEDKPILSEDGYRYKVVRKLKYRHRRDVNELPSAEYLPLAEKIQEEAVVEAVPEEKTVLAKDGYQYKTVRRLKYRHRRDVNELPSAEYLPPSEKIQEEAVVEAVPEEKTVLAKDGYRYKTVRRLKHRHRRDVNELPSGEYLPPSEKIQEEAIVEAVPESNTVLAEDGYIYKTVRRLKHRHRRDVNELPSKEYLPAAEEIVSVVSVPEEKTVLADDGYRYKTVRRLKYRHRRDVNELPANEYLPPTVAKSADLEVAVQNPEETAVLADDGYRYRTARKLKYRRH